MIDVKAKYQKPLPKCKKCGDRFTPFNNNGLQKFCMKKDGCVTAHAEWMRSEQGAKAKKTVQRKADKEKKVEIMSNDKYRAKYVQPVINEIARLIDYGCSCIATGNNGQAQGGHYFSTGSNRTLTFHLHNIHLQSAESNNHRSGDPIKYRAGLIERYGNDYFEYIESLQSCPPLKLTKGELIELKERAQKIRLRLKANPKQRSPQERIELRNQLNIELNIYPREYSEFNNKQKKVA